MFKTKKTLIYLLIFVLLLSAIPFSANAKVKAPAKPGSVSASSTVNSVTVKWKKVSKANGYVVYNYNTKTKKYKKLAATTKTSYKNTKLSAGTTYVYAVKSYKTVKKKKYFSAYSSKITVSTLPSKVTGLKVTSKGTNNVKLSWTKVKNATAYKLQYSTDKKFKSGVKSVSVTTNLKNITGLTSGKTYYFRAYAQRKISKKTYTSAVSSVVSAKTNTPPVIIKKDSTVDEKTTYQTIRGFGASAAWWSQKIGDWENAKDILKYLYDENEGIGLDIYRYNIGAGSIDDESVDYWGFRRTECFASSYNEETQSFTYDWGRDENARRCLELANEIAGGDLKVSLFSNSPPSLLTINGKTYCSYNGDGANFADWKSNIAQTNYAAYATFITDVADHFVEEGYNVYSVSPVNEPQYIWSQESEDGYVGHEGCHYTPIQCKMLYNRMVNAVRQKERLYKISMFEAGAAEGPGTATSETRFKQYMTSIWSDKTNKEYFDEVSVHSYWRTRNSKVSCRNYIDESFDGIDVSCTEYCQMANDACNGITEILKGLEGPDYNGMTIDFGVQMARVINDDLTALNAVEWNWWTACANGWYPDGLLYINDENHEDIQIPKRLWCLGNYSKFVEPGAVRVKITETQSDILSSAFKNTDGSLVIVYVNQTSSNKTVDLKASGYKNYSVYTTSDKYDIENTASGEYASFSSILLPAKSVVSVVLTK